MGINLREIVVTILKEDAFFVFVILLDAMDVTEFPDRIPLDDQPRLFLYLARQSFFAAFVRMDAASWKLEIVVTDGMDQTDFLLA